MSKVSRLRQEFPAHTAYGQGLTDTGFDLLNRLLALDPAARITAKEALDHRWCDSLSVNKRNVSIRYNSELFDSTATRMNAQHVVLSRFAQQRDIVQLTNSTASAFAPED